AQATGAAPGIKSIEIPLGELGISQGISMTQWTVSSISTILSWSSSIGFESFWPSVLLLMGIIHAIVMDVLVVVASLRFRSSNISFDTSWDFSNEISASVIVVVCVSRAATTLNSFGRKNSVDSDGGLIIGGGMGIGEGVKLESVVEFVRSSRLFHGLFLVLKTSLADKAILSGADNHLPMLEKDMYDFWKSRMELYMLNKRHGRMILESVENGLLLWPTIEENRVTRSKKYYELSTTEAIQADCDVKATNIILQGLLPEVYAMFNTHKVEK
nr:hypothetical protein [Tanacetum cinerariifolium]